MERTSWSAEIAASGSIDLVPRMKAQGYTRQEVDRRRAWLEAKTGGREMASWVRIILPGSMDFKRFHT